MVALEPLNGKDVVVVVGRIADRNSKLQANLQSNLQSPSRWRHLLLPGAMCILLMVASSLPWLVDPLGQQYIAWSLPVDTGWGVQGALLNYGTVCLGCLLLVLAGTIYIEYIERRVRVDWRGSTTHSPYTWRSARLAGVLCFVPVVLLVWQYLFADLPAMHTLAQHETQLLLIQSEFGYSSVGQFIRMQPFTASASTLAGRLSLLINMLGPGVFLPCIAGIMALVYAHLAGGSSWSVSILLPVRVKSSVAIVGCALLLVFLGRAPAAVACEYAAQQSLTVGDYVSALRWLDRALWLNPAFEQVPDFHIARGNARYYLFHENESDDGRAYVAFVYREQSNFLGADDELLQIWHSHDERVSPWVRDEMSITLERLSEHTMRDAFLPPIMRYNPAALPWLQLLGRVDPSNVYSQYVSGRIYYVQNSYDTCIAYMLHVLTSGSAATIRSSAYTYIGLSLERQGKTAQARQILFLAVRLDQYYHNNTAREELSGLH